MPEPMLFPLSARGVTVRFGDVLALRDVDLDIRPGDRIGVLGANGAGKSTLLRALHGLVEPAAGTVRWNGSASRPRSQAMVFQRPVLLRRSALANVEYGLAVNEVPRSMREALALAAIERVGLAHVARRPARGLSGGEQQRIALARAWALEPALLFLDEPTSNLDPAAAAEVERIAGDIHAAGTTVVMTTHNLGLARRFAREIVFLHEARITERTPAERFFRAPASPEAARFLEGELP
ncbi:MAG TPA: ATP-binding cassette domain-containing protein [Usitatibacter sp.]|nr:ATP-binding cassette domain-containing protein [Usitatibacter sp.]